MTPIIIFYRYSNNILRRFLFRFSVYCNSSESSCVVMMVFWCHQEKHYTVRSSCRVESQQNDNNSPFLSYNFIIYHHQIIWPSFLVDDRPTRGQAPIWYDRDCPFWMLWGAHALDVIGAMVGVWSWCDNLMVSSGELLSKSFTNFLLDNNFMQTFAIRRICQGVARDMNVRTEWLRGWW